MTNVMNEVCCNERCPLILQQITRTTPSISHTHNLINVIKIVRIVFMILFKKRVSRSG